MRKGILSLSKVGRAKTPGRKKTQNMEPAEKQAVKQAPAGEPMPPVAEDKPFVQTILVPKPGTSPKRVKRVLGTKKPPCGRQERK